MVLGPRPSVPCRLTRESLRTELANWTTGQPVTARLLLAKYRECYKGKYGLYPSSILIDDLKHFEFMLNDICDGNGAIAMQMIEAAFNTPASYLAAKCFSNPRFIDGFQLIARANQSRRRFDYSGPAVQHF